MRARCRLAWLALLLAAPLHAGQPRTWDLRGPGDLLAGELSGLSFDMAGHVTLAPNLSRLPEVGLPFVWSLCAFGQGPLYAGTGNDGQVLRVRDGQSQPFFKAAELEIHALACAPDGRVFVGSSPDGKVYVVEPDGQSKVYFDPEGKYIWGLALDGQGRLLVATGAPARLMRVDASAQATQLLATPETHFTALAIDPQGRAYVGSAPSGVVYAVETDGRARVLIDSDYREVKALSLGADGSVYAALFEGSGDSAAPSPTPSPAPTGSATANDASVTVTESFGVVVTSSTAGTIVNPAATVAIGRGALLRLFDGDVETLWTSYEDAPFALLAEGDGVWLGSGDKGRLLRVRNDQSWQLVGLLPASQITALTRSGAGLALGGSNAGVLFGLSQALGRSGTFTSAVKDSGAPSLWGRLRVELRQREAGTLALETRSGNSAVPDATWSTWAAAVEQAGSLHVASPRGRYLQVRVTLTGAAGRSPIFDGLTIFYLPRNLRPEVTQVLAHPPGEAFQKPIAVSGDAEVLGLLEATEESDPASAAANAAASMSAFSRKLRRRGLQTLSWRAQDANQDTLVYDVLYRPVEASDWRLLRVGLADPVLAWDTSTVPDGRYVVKVVARDTPSNAPEQALAGERESAPFDVDNTPPSVSATRLPGQTPRVRVLALDRGGAVQRAQYSVDGQAWLDLHPLDGLADSPEETYEWTPVLPAGVGAHVLMVRITDQLGNLATAQVALR